MKWSEVQKLIKEEIDSEIERNPTIAKNAFPQTEKDSEKAYKDAETKRVETNTKERHGALEAKETQQESVGFGADQNKGQERLKYDNINDKFQERVDALVMGKDSPSQKELDDAKQGISTTGNKKFDVKAKEMNKLDNNSSGFGKDNTAAVQLGDDIELLKGQKPAHQNSAFEGKIKKGDVFVETKKSLTLKVVGLSEDKKSIKFVDENNNKQYSLLKENFKKAISNKTLVKEQIDRSQLEIGAKYFFPAENQNVTVLNVIGQPPTTRIEYVTDDGSRHANLGYQEFLDHVEAINENISNENKSLKEDISGVNTYDSNGDRAKQELYNYWINAVKKLETANAKKWSDAFHQKYGTHPALTPQFEKDRKGQQALEQMGLMPESKKNDDKKSLNETVIPESKELKKRLVFNKTHFISEAHAISLIPEHFKVDGNKFYMLDNAGNEYKVEWKEKASILEHKNEKAFKDQVDRMKKLWEYAPQNTERANQEDKSILSEVRQKVTKYRLDLDNN